MELSGDDHLPFVGDQDEILVQIERFLSHARIRTGPERVLATVLTVTSDAGPADAEHLRRVFVRAVAWYRGRSVAADAEPLVAMFDGPGRAVQCGCSVAAVAQRSRIAVRAGVHIGECETSEPRGPIVEISRDIAATAGPGEVLVSRMVVDLVPGSGLQFVDRGALRLPGLSRELPVLAASRG